MLSNLSVDQALTKARSHVKKHETIEAQKLYQAVLQAFPKNIRAQQGLAALNVTNQTNSPPKETINHLVKLYNEGQLKAAFNKAQALTEQYPYKFILWNILGTSAVQLKMLDKAIEAFKKCISLKPDNADTYIKIGVALKRQGKFEDALKAYKVCVSLKPDYFVAYNNMGNVLKEIGDYVKAVKMFKKAVLIKPDYAEAYNNLGNTLQNQGELEEAIETYNKCILLKPNNFVAFNNLGNAFKELKKLGKAIKMFKKAISIKPDFAEAYNNLGVAQKELGELFDAIETLKKAVTIKKDYNEAHINLGLCLQEQNKYEEAINSFNEALLINPNYAKAYSYIGAALLGMDKLDDAIDACRKSILLKSDYAGAHMNIGNVFFEKGMLDEAIAAYKNAISVKPDYAEAYCNCTLVYNLKGDIQKGMELYEWRLQKLENKPIAPQKEMIWDGKKSLKGKRILVHEEKGLGDILQFSRYLLLLKEMGAVVTFKVKTILHNLLRSLDKDILLVDSLGKDQKFDFETPLLSLPYLFNTRLDTIPYKKPYLFASHDTVVCWSKKLRNKKFKIGICWQGSKHKVDIGRSFQLSLFKKIAEIQDIELISLHKGEGEEQINDISFNLLTLGDNFDTGNNAFIDTAAVMMNCDLIITSDTSTAHLAGALGCPTWVALKKIPDWRWFLDRNDSPWYSNVTLYRQKERGNWKYVFEKIYKDLQLLLKKERKIT